ncbi:MAG: 50S ribosomal protein L1 [Dehalococcoidia bacterium]|nr:50S ribosomal protein L1 [Dehalococcoidia bacterium]
MVTKVGKKHREALTLVDRLAAYSPEEAIALAKKAAHTRFDETVELHVRTGLDVRHADQQLRGSVLLPHGLGKTVRVLVFAEGEGARAAQESGAEFVGGDDLVKKVEGGWTDFDVALAQREMMGKVGRLGRVLGPRGLMPNPRSGTVVDEQDIARAVRDARQGRVEYRLDRSAIIHVPIGKIGFEEDKLLENLAAIIETIVKSRPAGAKGQFVRSMTLATSMGPGIKLEPGSTLALSTT